MLEKPDLPDAKLIAILDEAFGLRAARVAFLPLGADLNTAVYRAETAGSASYFVKLRRGAFDETSVRLPRFLHDQGVAAVIAPLPARDGQLWAGLEDFKVMLYPFIEGQDAYEVPLSDRQWIALGQSLRQVHTLALPPDLERRIRTEDYSSRWRDLLLDYLDRLAESLPGGEDPVVADLVAFLKPRRGEVRHLVDRAAALAQALRGQPREFVLCHSDLHAGNLLITPTGGFYIVDWDDAIRAPKERDLMYPGGGQFANRRTPQDEERLFYRGYNQGETLPEVDPVALAYYRYERIVADLAVECEHICTTAAGRLDREQSLRWLKSNFLPGNVLAIAYQSDQTRP